LFVAHPRDFSNREPPAASLIRISACRPPSANLAEGPLIASQDNHSISSQIDGKLARVSDQNLAASNGWDNDR